MLNFFPVHVPSADRAQPCLRSALAQRENKKDVAALLRASNCLEPLLLPRMHGSGNTATGFANIASISFNGHTVLAAFIPVAMVPVEAGNLKVRNAKMSIVHTFVKPLLCARIAVELAAKRCLMS
jgi:hypothetical protein